MRHIRYISLIMALALCIGAVQSVDAKEIKPCNNVTNTQNKHYYFILQELCFSVILM